MGKIFRKILEPSRGGMGKRLNMPKYRLVLAIK